MHSNYLTHSINNAKGKITNNNPFISDVPFHLGPVYRLPPKPIKHDTIINFDLKENSPFQEGIISETFQRPDRPFFKSLKN